MIANPPLPLSSLSLHSPQVMAWKGAKIHPVLKEDGFHSIHSYFVASPESPDGKYVLYYTSATAEGEQGEIRILERATGRERILARNIHTEDAHRAACQQWIADGKKIAYHDFRNGRWTVLAVDVASGEEKVLAMDRQIGFGTPKGNWVPIYGWHWKQGEHRDLELVQVETGEIRKVVRVDDVLKEYGQKVEEILGAGPCSIFFPVMSPDGKKVFFKLSHGSGTDDFKSPRASRREGKFVYSLETGAAIRMFPHWGHPSWTPDSAGIFEKYQEKNVLFDLATGEGRSFAEGSPTDHPSLAPNGRIFVTDGGLRKYESGKPGEWGIVVGSLEDGEFCTIYRFDGSGGANSWRKNHPHPVFSADGQRIYFNVNSGPWTRLYVAERSS